MSIWLRLWNQALGHLPAVWPWTNEAQTHPSLEPGMKRTSLWLNNINVHLLYSKIKKYLAAGNG